MTRHPRSKVQTVSVNRAVPTLPYRVEFRFPAGMLKPGHGLPFPAKNLATARSRARQIVQEGAEEARIVENSTGVVVKKYDRQNVPALAWKDGICPLRTKKA